MQPLCAVSRASTKVTISHDQSAEVFVDNELLMFAVSIRGYFGNIISPRSPTLPDNSTILHCLLNYWNHRYHSRLKYSKSYKKYPYSASKPKYIFPGVMKGKHAL